MTRSIIIYLCCNIIIFYGCDPGRVLIIKAAANPKVSITIFANKNILPSNKGNEKIIIQMPTSGPVTKYDTLFQYGLGTWQEEHEIEYFSNNIDSIIIKNSSGQEILKDKESIKRYLLMHRSGYLKSVLTIEAR